MSTSLNLNCSSAPPVSEWSTCVASPNAFIFSANPSREPHARLSIWTQLLLLAACDVTETDKLFSASTRSAFSASNDVVNSDMSAFALLSCSSRSARDCWSIEKLSSVRLVVASVVELGLGLVQQITEHIHNVGAVAFACHNHESGQLIVNIVA